jgi:proteic killer suppression protein
MVIKFNNRYLEALAKGEEKGKQRYSAEVVTMFKKRLKMIGLAKDSNDLRAFKSLHFELLQGEKKGRHYSIRINDKYRLEFSIEKNKGIIIEEIVIIEHLSNHYK